MLNFLRKPPPKPEASCPCGNHPLSAEDIAAGGKCLCCRTKHLFYHDDQFCRRCGCPREVAFGRMTWDEWKASQQTEVPA